MLFLCVTNPIIPKPISVKTAISVKAGKIQDPYLNPIPKQEQQCILTVQLKHCKIYSNRKWSSDEIIFINVIPL